MASMTRDQRDAFLREARIAKLVTLYGDGSPTIVPVWFEWDGEHARFFTGATSEKLRRIAADNRVALSMETAVGEKEAWVTIEGTAEVHREGGLALARRLIERYYDRERIAETWPQWERVGDGFVVVEITPTRIRSSAP